MAEEKPKVEAAPQSAAPAQGEPAQAQAAPQDAPKAHEPADAKKAQPVAVGKNARPKSCVHCNKTIKNKWYYKNGKYYCTKRCWKTTLAQPEKSAVSA